MQNLMITQEKHKPYVWVTNGKGLILQLLIWLTFVTVLWFSGPKLQTGLGYCFLWESCEIRFPKFTDNCDTVSSKQYTLTLQNSYNSYPIEITWRRMLRSVSSFSFFGTSVKGVLHLLTQKAALTCFVLYLKIVNNVLKNDICIL